MFQASSAARTFRMAVSRLKGGTIGLVTTEDMNAPWLDMGPDRPDPALTRLDFRRPGSMRGTRQKSCFRSLF